MSSNFPPSSPFLEPTTQDDDPFAGSQLHSNAKHLIINSPFGSKKDASLTSKTFQYPTPNPSSTTGARSSSPARHQQSLSPVNKNITSTTATTTTATAPIATTTKAAVVSSTLVDELRIRLYSQQAIKLGRSTHCDYFIKSKYASRKHLVVKYNAEDNGLTILCKGYNGVLVKLGQTYNGYIRQIKENTYKFIKKAEAKNDDEIFNEITVLKDEEITIPFNERLTLDIKGFQISLDVIDDLSETEDELPVLHQNETSSELSLLSEGQDTHPIERVKTIHVPSVPSVPIESNVSSAPIDPIVSNDSNVLEKEIEKVKPNQTEVISNPKKEKEIKRAPLAIKSESSLNTINNNQRRRKADPGLSPQKKKIDQSLVKGTKKYLDPREKIQNLKIEEILEEIKTNHDLDNIKNVLINHLAFSRLSQTPLKQLHTVSQSIQGLSRYQLRAILASVQCIGVIYRHGKDAAGKPLDEEYYYDVENDDDVDRTNLVSSIKGSSGLRNCRKTHKQYFWKKPVGKK